MEATKCRTVLCVTGLIKMSAANSRPSTAALFVMAPVYEDDEKLTPVASEPSSAATEVSTSIVPPMVEYQDIQRSKDGRLLVRHLQRLLRTVSRADHRCTRPMSPHRQPIPWQSSDHPRRSKYDGQHSVSLPERGGKAHRHEGSDTELQKGSCVQAAIHEGQDVDAGNPAYTVKTTHRSGRLLDRPSPLFNRP